MQKKLIIRNWRRALSPLLPALAARLPLAALLCAACAAGATASDITFLSPGARANAMGTAFSSVADDPYAVFYNPAGLARVSATENRFSLSGRLSPLAPAGEASFAYSRPVPETPFTAGLGYHAVRQNRTADLDALTAAMGSTFILKYLQRPVLYGAGVKLISLRDPKKSHLGLGFGGGLIFSSNSGLDTSLTLSDVMIGLGRSLATITVGNSYRVNDTLLAADLKVRGSYTELFFGLEHNLFNKLLQLRAGKGTALNGPGYLALGAGLNAAPWVIDFTASIPWKGFNQNAGLYGFSVGYRFGSPSFTESFVGEAGARAGALRSQVDDLRAQKASLESSINTYRANKGVLESDLTMMQQRMRDLERRLKELQAQIADAEYRKSEPRPAPRAAAPAPEKWPRLHKVLPGETLRSIASQYYGSPTLWERLYEANQERISRGLPVEGAVFVIPAPPAGK